MRKRIFPALTLAGVIAVAPAMAVAGGGLVLTVPVSGCEGAWLQVTTPDGLGRFELDGDVLSIVSGLVGEGVDHRFTVQTNLPVDGCSVVDPGVLTLDGEAVTAYQRDLAPEGANLQVTWRGETVPAVPLVPAEPVVPATPLTPAEPAVPATSLNPDDPVVPAVPLDPSSPVVPATPLTPAEPVVPAVPLNPAEPVVPVTPLTPAAPVEPVSEEETPRTVTPRTTNLVVDVETTPLVVPAQGVPAEAAVPVIADPVTVG